MGRVALWLFVINLGVAFGAGLYEHRIVTPGWFGADGSAVHWDAAAARRDDTGLRFWAYATTGPLTLLTLVNLFAAWRASGSVRGWWLAASVIVLAERLFTFAYFVPTMVRLMGAADSPASVAAALRWSSLNYFRHVLVLSGWLSALKALSLLR